MKALTRIFLLFAILCTGVAYANASEEKAHSSSPEDDKPVAKAHMEEEEPFKEFPLVVVVNEANPLTNLSSQQIELIYSGDAADWRALGDKEQFMRAYALGPMHDAYKAFVELGLSGRQYGPDVHFYDNIDVILEKVANRDNAIAVLPFPFMKTEGVKVLAVDTLPPTLENYPYKVTADVAGLGGDQEEANAGHAVHWSYEGETGPENWGDLSPEFALCKTGLRQSPINLKDAKAKSGTPLDFNYKASPIHLVNNGHTIQLNYEEGSYVVYLGKRFDLKQLHFHSKSEHTVDELYSDMEMHLVHAADDGELLVVGVLFEKGPLNRFLSRLWPFIPEKKDAVYESDATINAEVALPVIRSVYNYKGSLTTPPGSEGVNWFVFANPVSISPSQLDQFRAVYEGNFRPIQNTNGRSIYLYTR